ncbi:hypothetical protein [Burkholderia sp. 4M9327F10]|uniref:hypothetical protein n=1 Tax=Burkholderia sp. 4M9327F10 TaxID=2502223 RepID=UPI001484ECE4|nr:hypothetical protein [Burkholderia sp. 4M9327F10]
MSIQHTRRTGVSIELDQAVVIRARPMAHTSRNPVHVPQTIANVVSAHLATL